MTTSLKTLTTAADNAQKALGLKYRPVVIRNEQIAWSIADRCTKPQIVMLGDDAYWVVCPADAARLEKAGYEYAPR